MPLPSRWLWLPLLCLGCQSALSIETPPRTPAAPAENPAPPAGPAQRQVAQQLWEEGQRAMRLGQPDRAVALYEQSLAADPQLTRNHLSLAAAYLEKGDEAAACPHLDRYLRSNPQHTAVRVQYAELLWRLKRLKECRAAFASAVADAEEEMPASHLIHCHSRLMQLAEAADDEYGEHLHRGIGLYLLARERAALGEVDAPLTTEGLLCRAAGELTLAHIQKPDEARPSWYLHKVWARLAQRQPALRALREASASAPFSYLTPAEQRGLELACAAAEQTSPK
jgi:tetratricopeptide (TPR) repeat protein